MEPYTVGQIELEKTVRMETWKFGWTEPYTVARRPINIPVVSTVGPCVHTVRTKEEPPTDNNVVVSAEPYNCTVTLNYRSPNPNKYHEVTRESSILQGPVINVVMEPTVFNCV
eukprot:scaffold141521_cov66-Attheya_sp.AAC.3